MFIKAKDYKRLVSEVDDLKENLLAMSKRNEEHFEYIDYVLSYGMNGKVLRKVSYICPDCYFVYQYPDKKSNQLVRVNIPGVYVFAPTVEYSIACGNLSDNIYIRYTYESIEYNYKYVYNRKTRCITQVDIITDEPLVWNTIN